MYEPRPQAQDKNQSKVILLQHLGTTCTLMFSKLKYLFTMGKSPPLELLQLYTPVNFSILLTYIFSQKLLTYIFGFHLALLLTADQIIKTLNYLIMEMVVFQRTRYSSLCSSNPVQFLCFSIRLSYYVYFFCLSMQSKRYIYSKMAFTNLSIRYNIGHI